MLTVKIEDVIEFAKFRNAVNKENILNITFTRADVPIYAEKADLEEWKFTGLGNYDYARYELLTEEEQGQIG